MSVVNSSIEAFEAKRAAEKRRSAILDPTKMQGLKTLLETCVQDFSNLIDGRRHIQYKNVFQAINLGRHDIAGESLGVFAEPSIFHAISHKDSHVYKVDPATDKPALVGMRLDLVALPYPEDIELSTYDSELSGSVGTLLVARHELKYLDQLHERIAEGTRGESQGTLEVVTTFAQILDEVRVAEAQASVTS